MLTARPIELKINAAIFDSNEIICDQGNIGAGINSDFYLLWQFRSVSLNIVNA